jgi:hypothetical protein
MVPEQDGKAMWNEFIVLRDVRFNVKWHGNYLLDLLWSEEDGQETGGLPRASFLNWAMARSASAPGLSRRYCMSATSHVAMT